MLKHANIHTTLLLNVFSDQTQVSSQDYNLKHKSFISSILMALFSSGPASTLAA
jgi:hypothetical protein